MAVRRIPDGGMSDEQFRLCAGKTRISARLLSFARAVLVDGLRVTDVANANGVTRSQLSQVVAKIHGIFRRNFPERYPDSWQTLTVIVPSDLAGRIRAMEDDAHLKYEDEQRNRNAKVTQS